ncbi:uncharacterized protein LOC124279072 [Haliotis rubra]|uniref:uncharacterized protein LOC124279072 n=1 Tax=Haliotis rubra TaxID=36100 RepID=UPI001EE5A2F9|nr:uncharacterized protein LOC124279072 [Haliotis rubra]
MAVVKQLSDAILDMESFKDVAIKSFDHRLPQVKQRGNSQENIEQHVLKRQHEPADQVVIYPRLSDQNGKHLSQLLKQRLQASNSVGLAYIAKNLAVSANFVAKPKPDSVLLDVCLITETKPTMILSVVKEEDSQSTTARRYNLSLAKGVNDAIRRFTDQQFSSVYGVINEKELSEQCAFDNVLSNIKKAVSRICVTGSLAMSVQKYPKVLHAFLNSIAVTRFVTGAAEDASSLWLLTLEQFCILTENVSEKEVTVLAKPHCGGNVLLHEVASRLNKGGPTMLLLHSRNQHLDFARKMSVCRHIFTLGEFTEKQDRECLPSEVENLVTDCTQTEISKLGLHPKCAWYFRYSGDAREIELLEDRLQSLESKGSTDDRQWASGKVDGYDDNCLITLGEEKSLEQTFDKKGDLYKFLQMSMTRKRRSILCSQEKVLFLRNVARSLNERGLDIQRELDASYAENSNAEISPFRNTDLKKDDKCIRKRKKSPLNKLHKRRKCETDTTHKERSVPNAGISSTMSDEAERNHGHKAEEDMAELKQKVTEIEQETTRIRQQRHSIRTVEWRAVLDQMTRKADVISVISELEPMLRKSVPGVEGNPGSTEHQNCTRIISGSHGDRNNKHALPYRLAQFQHGTESGKDLLSLAKQMITEDNINQVKFEEEECSLENYVASRCGCPIHVIGMLRACCRLLECPRLSLDTASLDTDKYHITEEDELVNSPGTSQSSDARKLKMYWGICSSTPIDLTNILPSSHYWEIHCTVGVIKGWWRIVLDFGVVEETQVDRERWACYQPRSWCVCLEDCDIHTGVCAKVFNDKKHVKCFPDAVSLIPGTQASLHYGVVLDVGRGRISFIDVTREVVLGKFDVVFRENLYPVFGVTPRQDRYTVRMKLVSGEDVTITESKRDLIYKTVT